MNQKSVLQDSERIADRKCRRNQDIHFGKLSSEEACIDAKLMFVDPKEPKENRALAQEHIQRWLSYDSQLSTGARIGVRGHHHAASLAGF